MQNKLIEKLSNDLQIMNKFNNSDFKHLIINIFLPGFMEVKTVTNLEEFELIVNDDYIKIKYGTIDCARFSLKLSKIKDCEIEKDDKEGYFYQIYFENNESIHLSFHRV